jgi:hypothetical protein
MHRGFLITEESYLIRPAAFVACKRLDFVESASTAWCEEGYGLGEGEYWVCRAVLGKEVDDYEGGVAEMGRKLVREEAGSE